eukprot:TRINITY_DN19199_c0_g1_i1.p1 TRINITY_DN19199_c0_g1~~TRINITY_DN19199_c0_g1_i1.p1  ORF type:complete len:265 (-),score=71.64 TRINITY_DN19199_c0_g1_i1:63-833(-)
MALQSWFKPNRDLDSVVSPKVKAAQEAAIQRRVQERCEKMRAAEKEYQQKLDQIRAKPPEKLTDMTLPSHEARLKQKAKEAHEKLAKSDSEYKAWLGDTLKKHEERVMAFHAERSQALKEARESAAKKMEAVRRSKSTPDVKRKPTTLTAEEIEKIRQEVLHPVWDKSIRERADMEKEFMRWTKNLKKTTSCAIDHHFTGELAAVKAAKEEELRQARREALRNANKTEKSYWDWSQTLKTKHKCSIDQSIKNSIED